jgi:hypothetical protein
MGGLVRQFGPICLAGRHACLSPADVQHEQVVDGGKGLKGRLASAGGRFQPLEVARRNSPTRKLNQRRHADALQPDKKRWARKRFPTPFLAQVPFVPDTISCPTSYWTSAPEKLKVKEKKGKGQALS